MSENKPKSHEHAKKNSDDYVPMISKGGSKGFVKRDRGPAKHHVPFGRHKVEEQLLSKDLIEDIIEDIETEKNQDD